MRSSGLTIGGIRGFDFSEAFMVLRGEGYPSRWLGRKASPGLQGIYEV